MGSWQEPADTAGIFQESEYGAAGTPRAELGIAIDLLELIATDQEEYIFANHELAAVILEAFCVNLKALVRTSAERRIVEIQYLRPWLISQGGLRGSFDA